MNLDVLEAYAKLKLDLAMSMQTRYNLENMIADLQTEKELMYSREDIKDLFSVYTDSQGLHSGVWVVDKYKAPFSLWLEGKGPLPKSSNWERS